MSESTDGANTSSVMPPALPLAEWKDTKETLHRYAQIVGKVRLEYSRQHNARSLLPRGHLFWLGDQNVREPAFYSYTAPEPEGPTEQPLRLEAAFWTP